MVESKLIVYTSMFIMACALIAVFYTVQDTFSADARTLSASVTKEAVTATTDGVFLARNQSSVKCFGEVSIVEIRNGTADTGVVVNSGNYSIRSADGLIKNTTGTYMGTWYVNYTYKTGTEACEGIDETFEIGDTFGEWLDILIIVAITSILIAIVYFIVRGRGSSSTAV